MIKKVIAHIMVICLCFGVFCCYAKESSDEKTKKNLLDYTAEECLEFLMQNGVVIKDDSYFDFAYFAFRKIAENPNCLISTFDVNEVYLMESIRGVVLQYFEANDTSRINNNRYLLQFSTMVTDWDDDYYAYNCYAFALDMFSGNGFLRPGYTTNNDNYSNLNMPSLSTLVLYTANDIRNRGNACLVYGTSCYSLSNLLSSQTLICLRRGYKFEDFSKADFHFMRYHPASASWLHKPAHSIPLRLNSSPWSYTYWINEGVGPYGAFEGNTYYDSTIYYFLYSRLYNSFCTFITWE